MTRLKYQIWGVGNILMTLIIATPSWALTLLAAITIESAWPVSILLVLLSTLGVVPGAAVYAADALVSFALARLAKTSQGKLAHLVWGRYGPDIVLDTENRDVVRWQRIGQALVWPGGKGLLAALVLTVGGGLALSGPIIFGWPVWASIPFVIMWAAGWAWYATLVRARLRRRR